MTYKGAPINWLHLFQQSLGGWNSTSMSPNRVRFGRVCRVPVEMTRFGSCFFIYCVNLYAQPLTKVEKGTV